jgi:hypothetical protein
VPATPGEATSGCRHRERHQAGPAHGLPPVYQRRRWLLVRYLWASPNTLFGLLFLPTAALPGARVQVVGGVLEMHGPLIAAFLRHCVPLRGGASALTFGHVVLASSGRALDATRQHERVHVRQCEIWGPAFIPAYLIAALWALSKGAGAYSGNYFERQARQCD